MKSTYCSIRGREDVFDSDQENSLKQEKEIEKETSARNIDTQRHINKN